MASVLSGSARPSMGHPRRRRAMDPDARARLAALGYVATFAADAPRDRSQLADPKDKIDLFNLMTDAREQLLRDAESDKGLASLQKVVAQDPNVVDAWLMMGRHLARRHEYDRALDSFRRALSLKPDYDLAVINMAAVYRHLGVSTPRWQDSSARWSSTQTIWTCGRSGRRC